MFRAIDGSRKAKMLSACHSQLHSVSICPPKFSAELPGFYVYIYIHMCMCVYIYICVCAWVSCKHSDSLSRNTGFGTWMPLPKIDHQCISDPDSCLSLSPAPCGPSWLQHRPCPSPDEDARSVGWEDKGRSKPRSADYLAGTLAFSVAKRPEAGSRQIH